MFNLRGMLNYHHIIRTATLLLFNQSSEAMQFCAHEANSWHEALMMRAFLRATFLMILISSKQVTRHSLLKTRMIFFELPKIFPKISQVTGKMVTLQKNFFFHLPKRCELDKFIGNKITSIFILKADHFVVIRRNTREWVIYTTKRLRIMPLSNFCFYWHEMYEILLLLLLFRYQQVLQYLTRFIAHL